MAFYILPPSLREKNGIYEMADLPASCTILGIFKESSYAVMIDNKDVQLVNGIGYGAGSYVRDSGLFAGTLIAALETHTRVSNYTPRNKPEDVAEARAQLKAIGGEDFVTPDDPGFAELFQQHRDAFEQKCLEYRAEQARRMKSLRW
jgi:hypothetical protein